MEIGGWDWATSLNMRKSFICNITTIFLYTPPHVRSYVHNLCIPFYSKHIIQVIKHNSSCLSYCFSIVLLTCFYIWVTSMNSSQFAIIWSNFLFVDDCLNFGTSLPCLFTIIYPSYISLTFSLVFLSGSHMIIYRRTSFSILNSYTILYSLSIVLLMLYSWTVQLRFSFDFNA